MTQIITTLKLRITMETVETTGQQVMDANTLKQYLAYLDQYLPDVQSLIENPDALLSAFSFPNSRPFGKPFHAMMRNYDGSYVSLLMAVVSYNIACPLMVKQNSQHIYAGCSNKACNSELQQLIAGDPDIPSSADGLVATHECLFSFADYQARCDLYYAQLREIDAQPVYL